MSLLRNGKGQMVLRRLRLGIVLEGGFEGAHRCVDTATLELNPSERVVGVRVWLDASRSLCEFQRLVEVAVRLCQAPGQIVARLGVAGFDSHRLAQQLLGLLRVAQHRRDPRRQVERLGIIGRSLDRIVGQHQRVLEISLRGGDRGQCL